MAFVNLKDKEIQVKIVYYGPGRGGKTTNLEFIHKKLNHRTKTDMVSIKTDEDRTLFFDFLPLDIGNLNGFNVKIQLFTVPGQVKYNSTRRLVLKGVDGLVFVADAQMKQREKNLVSLRNLEENLSNSKKGLSNIPCVIQYNKMDLSDKMIPIMSVEMLEKDLNMKLNCPSFTASAIYGKNVIATLKKTISTTMADISKDLQTNRYTDI